MIVRVERQSRRRWAWECHWCHRGDVRNTWADAFAEALAHPRVHAAFGFRRTVG